MRKAKKIKPALTPLSVDLVDGEYFTFRIGSRSRPDRTHFVDLEENEWNGKCDCEFFSMKCQPKLNRGATPCDGLRCAHIRRARSYLLDNVLPKLSAALKDSNREREAAGIKTQFIQPATDETKHRKKT
jgi:hypothetical protein